MSIFRRSSFKVFEGSFELANPLSEVDPTSNGQLDFLRLSHELKEGSAALFEYPLLIGGQGTVAQLAEFGRGNGYTLRYLVALGSQIDELLPMCRELSEFRVDVGGEAVGAGFCVVAVADRAYVAVVDDRAQRSEAFNESARMFVSVRQPCLKPVQFALVGVEFCAHGFDLGADIGGTTQFPEDEVRGPLDRKARFTRRVGPRPQP